MSAERIEGFGIYCDGCETEHDEGQPVWDTPGEGIDSAVCSGWFYSREKYFDRILCPRCQTCEVCKAPGHEVDGHLVCEEHEDHGFTLPAAVAPWDGPRG